MANTYTTYKDSGIPWIGEIPSEWNLERLQTMTYEIVEKNNPIQTNNVLSLTIKDGVIPYEEKGDVGNKSKDNYEEYKLAYPETIVLNSMNILIGAVGLCKYFGCVSPVYYVLKNSPNSNLKYLFYILSSQPFQRYLRKFANGILEIRLRISSQDIIKRHIPCPSLYEQDSIANFLDKKCSEIDELISLQEKMIDELKAYKQSVITEAVTKGLDRKVKMKDSGVATIGEIPNHWKLVHFSKVNYIRARLGWKGLKAEEYVEQGHPFLSAFNIINDKLDWNDLNFINDIRYEESPEIKLSTNDLVLVKDGAGIGKCAVVESLPFGTATVNSSLAVITPLNYVNSKYQYYCLKSEAFQTIIWQLKIGMGVPHLTQENMKAIINPCPPIEEQKQIASYLDTKCSQIDSLISIKEKKIEELKDYKKSLIYEYVTGKKRV